MRHCELSERWGTDVGGVDRLRCCSTIPTERVLSDAVEVGVVVESLRRVGRFSLCGGGVAVDERGYCLGIGVAEDIPHRLVQLWLLVA